MYLMKEIQYDYHIETPIVDNGIQVAPLGENQRIIVPSFWGKTKVNVGDYADFFKMPLAGPGFVRLPYVSEYYVNDLYDGYKEFVFNVSKEEPENVEGYIIFMQHESKIKTDGEKLYRRYPNEIIAVLREGNYLEFSGRRIEVVNNKLILFI